MRFFKQGAGMTFVDYLTHVRLTRARQLLSEKHLSIAEISKDQLESAPDGDDEWSVTRPRREMRPLSRDGRIRKRRQTE